MHIFYGDSGSGKKTAARRLAEELRVAHGWSSCQYYHGLLSFPRPGPPLAPVIVIDNEQKKPVGMAAFHTLTSSEPVSWRMPYGAPQATAIETLIIGMNTRGPRSIAVVSVSLVVKVHALQTLLSPHLGIFSAMPILKLDLHALQMLAEICLPYKVWLIMQLPLLPEMRELITKAFKKAVEDSLVQYLTDTIDWVTVRRFSIMEAIITYLPGPTG